MEIDATIISVIQGKTPERELEKWDMRIVEEREDIVRSMISFNDVMPVIVSDVDDKCVGAIGCTSQAGEALEQAEQIGCVWHDNTTSGVGSHPNVFHNVSRGLLVSKYTGERTLFRLVRSDPASR
jgi:hypothetical protein